MTTLTSSTLPTQTGDYPPYGFDDGPTDPSRSGSSAAASSATIPLPTGYGSPDNVQGGDHDALNFYFLILAVFIICAAVLYCTCVRRRRNKIRRSTNNGQNALAQDIQGVPVGRRWAIWRTGVQDPKPEEGLDERGEAPPPYMPKFPPAAAHPDGGRGGPYSSSDDMDIPLQDLSRHGDGKPPEYSVTSTSEHNADLARPALSRAGSSRMGSSRNLVSSREV